MINSQIKTILLNAQILHQHLLDLFPHEGLKRNGGSKIFLGGKLSVVIESRLDELIASIQFVKIGEYDFCLNLLRSAKTLFRKIDSARDQASPEQINDSIVLIFLISGTVWNFIALEFPNMLAFDDRCYKVDPMIYLQKRCLRKEIVGTKSEFEEFIKKLGREVDEHLRR